MLLQKNLLLITLILLLKTNLTYAFSWEAHREITKRGMIGLDISAMKNVIEGNLSVDQGNLEKKRAPHFDSEHFSGGANFIHDRLKKAQASLIKCDIAHSRKMFGQALHSIQDFYAHSNWVEKNLNNLTSLINLLEIKDHPRSIRQSWIPGRCCLDMSRNDCRQVPLTTGFMVRDNLLWRRCTHNQLNKDHPNKRFHSEAKDAATHATTRYFKLFIKNLIEAYGENKASRLIENFTKLEANKSANLCKQEMSESTCKVKSQDSSVSQINQAMENIFNKLMDNELPENIYE